MSKEQRLQFEKKLEDEYVTGEFTWNTKKETIIKAWADSLSHHISPHNLICHYIKQKLRARQISEGSIAYVHECLTDDYAKYKDPKFDSSDSITTERRGNPRPSIFEDYDDVAHQTLSPEELDNRSDAEIYEIITRENRMIKGIKTKLSDRMDVTESYCRRRQIMLPEFQKESSDIPPERFHGQSEMFYTLEGIENELRKLTKSVEDVKKTVYYFRPTPEVAARCSKLLKEWDVQLKTLVNAIMVVVKAYENITTPVSDGKWGTLLDGWFKIGWDQKVNCGSHGSGVTNSIDTGEYVIKEYRDGRKEVIGLKREFTREQVADKVQRDLLKLAMIAVSKDKAQQALSYWIANTNLVEIIGDSK